MNNKISLHNVMHEFSESSKSKSDMQGSENVKEQNLSFFTIHSLMCQNLVV